MRVFVAGASGAIGRRLIPRLIDRGHEGIGAFKNPAHVEQVRSLGAKPVVLDVLDRAAVCKAVLETRPEVIIHEATALGVKFDFKNLDRSFAQNK